jgi:hypothetical protein
LLAYVSIRQHTSVYLLRHTPTRTQVYLSFCIPAAAAAQHTPAIYLLLRMLSIRQLCACQSSAYAQHTPALRHSYMCPVNTCCCCCSAYASSIPAAAAAQHTPALRLPPCQAARRILAYAPPAKGSLASATVQVQEGNSPPHPPPYPPPPSPRWRDPLALPLAVRQHLSVCQFFFLVYWLAGIFYLFL